MGSHDGVDVCVRVEWIEEGVCLGVWGCECGGCIGAYASCDGKCGVDLGVVSPVCVT